jgi:hypothetical protein
MKTAVLQSFRKVDVPAWMASCMRSVREWAEAQGWQYCLLDDQFFDLAPAWARRRCGRNLYAITDVARLIWMREVLSRRHDRVVWADADVLVLDPKALADHVCSVRGHGFARELFLRVSADGSAQPQWGVNTALMVFDHSDPVHAAYLQACLHRLRQLPDGEVPRTAMGPDLLHEIARGRRLQFIEGVGLFTPAMLDELVNGDGALLRHYRALSRVPLAAANLCHFMRNATAPSQRPAFDRVYEAAVAQLIGVVA